MIEHDISRGRNNAASQAAYKSHHGAHANARERIYALIEDSSGMTSKEISQKLGWPIHTLSGRVSELKAAGRIRGTGERRYGAEVVVAVRFPEQLSFSEVA